MKVAIPVWGDKISPVFDTATRLMIVDTEAENSGRISLSLEGDDLARRCARMKELGVETLICGAISNPFCRRLMAVNIDVIQGISGPREDVLQAFLKGRLDQESFLMPWCRRGMWGRGGKGFSEDDQCRKRTSGKARDGRCRLRTPSSKQKTKKEA